MTDFEHPEIGAQEIPLEAAEADVAEQRAPLRAVEGLDEDELGVDPLEEGMDPPERWAESTKYGMTSYEERHPADFDDRLREEEPDVQPE